MTAFVATLTHSQPFKDDSADQCMADLYDTGPPGSDSFRERNADVFWLLLGSFLVFYMQAGFAMLEAGQVRVKNRNVTLMKNVMDATTGGIVWYLCGYVFAFSDGGRAGVFIGLDWGMFSGCANFANWIWQWTFAATSATIVSGAIAERCRFFAYLCLSVLMQGFVYPVVAHWVWSSQGWLGASVIGGNGLMDFAGSGVVHITGGTAALVGAYIIGPRAGRYSFEGRMPFKPNDVALTALGTFSLWFSWFGFNCVSTGAFAQMYTASRIAVVTALGGCAGGIGSLIVNMCVHHHPDIMMTLNGILAGLVSITAGANVLDPGLAIVVGLVGGALCFAGSFLLKTAKIDDAVDATAVHFVGGIWGLISTGIFAHPRYVNNDYFGLIYGGSPVQFGIQILGVVSITAFSGILLGGAFLLLRVTGTLRVSFDEEVLGLDKIMGDHFQGDSQQAFPPTSTPVASSLGQSLGSRSPRQTNSSQGVQFPAPMPSLSQYLSHSEEHKRHRQLMRISSGRGHKRVSFGDQRAGTSHSVPSDTANAANFEFTDMDRNRRGHDPIDGQVAICVRDGLHYNTISAPDR